MVDTLLANPTGPRLGGTLAGLGLRAGGYGLVTLHRPANVDDPAVLGALLPALAEIAARVPARAARPPAGRPAGCTTPGIPAAVRIIPPLGYLDFIALEASARLVLTDSGGVQEETTVLGVPCLTLRDNTERPITLTEGTNRLVGRDPDRIVRAAREVLAAPPPAPRQPALWDGQAGRASRPRSWPGMRASDCGPPRARTPRTRACWRRLPSWVDDDAPVLRSPGGSQEVRPLPRPQEAWPFQRAQEPGSGQELLDRPRFPGPGLEFR